MEVTGDGGRGGQEETKMSGQGAREKKLAFLALCMSHASANQWLHFDVRYGRQFRDAMRLVQLEELLRMEVRT